MIERRQRKDHREHTDGSFRPVCDNLKRLIRDGGRLRARLPVIPGETDTRVCRNGRAVS